MDNMEKVKEEIATLNALKISHYTTTMMLFIWVIVSLIMKDLSIPALMVLVIQSFIYTCVKSYSKKTITKNIESFVGAKK